MGDVYLLSTQEYREWVRIHEESPAHLRGDSQSPQPSLEQIPSLVSAVRQPVNAISSQPKQNVSAASDPFGVQEAARKLGCAPAFVRTLVREGKLGHRWIGRKLRFRQEHIEQFWASPASAGADAQPKSRRNSRLRAGKGKDATTQTDDNVKTAQVFPSREEFKKLCRS
jgi:excisionase family DNA binding protein